MNRSVPNPVATVEGRVMRIAVISTFLPDYSFELCKRLAASCKIALLVDADKFAASVSDGELLAKPSSLQIATFAQSKMWRRWRALIKVAVLLIRFRPDIVIGHEHAHPHVTWMYRVAARVSRLILIVHDPEPHMGRDHAFQQRNAAQTAAQRRLPRIMLAHGGWCVEQLRQMLPVGAPHVCEIPLGANFFPNTASPLTFSRRILMFGRMEAYKGLDLLLEAARLLRTRGIDFTLCLAGSGPSLDELRDEFAAMPECEIEGGYIDVAQAKEYFHRADVIVAPYLEATQSGVVSQAFAFGRPVVATRVGGLPDVVVDGVNGRLTDPNDAVALADALADSIEDRRMLRTLSEGAQTTYRQKLSWEVIAKVFLSTAQYVAVAR